MGGPVRSYWMAPNVPIGAESAETLKEIIDFNMSVYNSVSQP